MTPGSVSDPYPGPPDGSVLDVPIHVVFDGPPSAEGPRFVEVEDAQGQSVLVGEWRDDPNSATYKVLRVTARDILQATGYRGRLEILSCAYCGFDYEGDQPVSRDALDAHVRVCPQHPLGREIANARLVLRGHTDECTAVRPFFGTASEDPGCDCGFRAATERGLGREVLDAAVNLEGPFEVPAPEDVPLPPDTPERRAQLAAIREIVMDPGILDRLRAELAEAKGKAT